MKIWRLEFCQATSSPVLTLDVTVCDVKQLNSLVLPAICKNYNQIPISSKWPFWCTEMANLWLKKYFLSIATYFEPKNSIVFKLFKLYLNYFPHSKISISEHKNGCFEEKRAWLQILEWGSNSTISYLTFDTHDIPGADSIWKWEIYRPHLLVWQFDVIFEFP